MPLTTSNFVVSGHQFNGVLPTPLTVHRVNYTRNATNTFFDVFATSELGATVTATIPPAPAVTLAAGLNELAGLFWSRSSFASNFVIPPTVSITASLAGSTNTIVYAGPHGSGDHHPGRVEFAHSGYDYPGEFQRYPGQPAVNRNEPAFRSHVGRSY